MFGQAVNNDVSDPFASASAVPTSALTTNSASSSVGEFPEGPGAVGSDNDCSTQTTNSEKVASSSAIASDKEQVQPNQNGDNDADAVALTRRPPLPNTKIIKPVINRNGSASLFQGKAPVVSGASPFDSLPSAPSLFAPAATTSSASNSSNGNGAMALPPSVGPKVVLNRVSSNSTIHNGSGGPFGNQASARESAESVFSSVPAGLFGSASAAPSSQAAALFDSGGAPGVDSNRFASSSPFGTNANASGPGSSSLNHPIKSSFVQTASGPGTAFDSAIAASSTMTRSASPASASDIFSKHPPAGATSSSASSTSAALAAGIPPSAPGVRAPPPNTNPNPVARPTKPIAMTPGNTHSTSNHSSNLSPVPPPGMIPTPHGYVPAPPLSTSHQTTIPAAPITLSASGSRDQAASSIPALKAVDTASSHPNPQLHEQQHTFAASNVSKPPIPSINTFAPSATAAARSSSSTGLNVNQRPSANACAGRPPCPVVAFGFGGRIAVMIPKAKKTLNPLLVTPEDVAKPYSPGAVEMYRLIDLVDSQHGNTTMSDAFSQTKSPPAERASTCGYSSHNQEMATTLELLNMFKTPLGKGTSSGVQNTGTAAAKGSDDGASVMRMIQEQISRRIDSPISASLSDKFFQAAQSHSQQSSHNDHRGEDSCYRVPSRNTRTVSEKLMWMLLKTIVETNGAVASNSAGSQNSPEARIARLLIDGPAALASQPSLESNASAVPAPMPAFPVTGDIKQVYSGCPTVPASSQGVSRSDCYASVECLLLAGRRDEAVSVASSSGDWALALLIASNCGQDKYQEVCRAYAAATLPQNSPLHLASMVFSNQANALLLHGGKRLCGAASVLDGSHNQSHNQSLSTSISSIWRRHLAMVSSLLNCNYSSSLNSVVPFVSSFLSRSPCQLHRCNELDPFKQAY